MDPGCIASGTTALYLFRRLRRRVLAEFVSGVTDDVPGAPEREPGHEHGDDQIRPRRVGEIDRDARADNGDVADRVVAAAQPDGPQLRRLRGSDTESRRLRHSRRGRRADSAHHFRFGHAVEEGFVDAEPART